MKAIEIYDKIMDIIKDENPNDVHAALHFIMRENENRMYQSSYNGQAIGSISSGLIPFP